MIDARRINDKTKHGTQYNVGNITLFVTSEFWGGRWHLPTIQLQTVAENNVPMRHLTRDRVTELDWDTLTDIAEASRKAQREWLQVENWRARKNSEISQKTLGAS